MPSYNLVKGTTYSTGMTVTAANLNAHVDVAKIAFTASDILVGRSSSGAGDWEDITCTAAGRALLDDLTSTAQRTTLGLGPGDSPTFANITVTGTITGTISVPANTLTGTTLATNVTIASLNSILPGGTLTIGGQVNSTAAFVSTATTPYFVGNSVTAGAINYGSIGSASPSNFLVNNITVASVSASGFAVIGAVNVTGDLTLARTGVDTALNINAATGFFPVLRFLSNSVPKWAWIGEYPGAGNISLFDYLAGSIRAQFSTNGFGITGSLTVTTNAGQQVMGDFISTNTDPYIRLQNPAGVQAFIQVLGSGFVGFGSITNNPIQFRTNNVTAATLSTTVFANVGDITQTGVYHNFTATQGTTGYGIRNNGGVMEFKNNGGGWAPIGSGGGGVSSVGIAGNNGISVAGSPITSAGTMTLGLGAITPSSVNVSGVYSVAGTQVVGARNAAIANVSPTGTWSSDMASYTTCINTILGTMRNHGLIAP